MEMEMEMLMLMVIVMDRSLTVFHHFVTIH